MSASTSCSCSREIATAIDASSKPGSASLLDPRALLPAAGEPLASRANLLSLDSRTDARKSATSDRDSTP
eukprot:CAMPEP_0185852274 /NCGR_PEP_ID=MMETSP1354-20130828/13989_1 /TAXON_ID=708628 /ORGANISM="Erythrolobus madagascarensis, Strain CCMP3276" /LENGTH=69 /DNA_ID=CAMNT_0028553473 /DNA_START=51 /DNA_END=256 /DNA_ORIENTATION=+